jgi:hypothetical protein
VAAPWQVSPPGALGEPLVAQGVALAAALLLLRAGLDPPWWGFVALVVALGVALHAAGVLAVAGAARRWARLASELPFSCCGLEALFVRTAQEPVRLRVHLSPANPDRTAEVTALARASGFHVLRSFPGGCELSWRLATWRLAGALRRLGRSGAIASVRLAAQTTRLPSITSRA